ncbi:MAG TPA: aldo/keto reductase [Thauera sp.]|uniref:aldo/keto reductase n=1 Tax=Thauera sp. TaxID=1905334 RepID=UPI002C9C2DC4|nr:aldo/keto reductase [Thauera sp.]HRP26243.1 aldo/keto reductase [Thauera sp.]HRP67042.1 aldo/keto reductase [Thauera sp.]
MSPTPLPPDPALPMSRARFLRLAAASAAGLFIGAPTRATPASAATVLTSPAPTLRTRPIPTTGEPLPVIGCGTYIGFDVARDSEQYQRLPGVLQALFGAGGSVIDSSPMYGRAEAVTGELLAATGSHGKAFVATKVWTRGRAEGIRQMEESLRRLQVERLDLMQVHNLVDWQTQLATLRDWKAAGRVRYLGVTHYTAGAYDTLEAVMRAEPLDFLQINYSLDEREAERRILPLAAERGMAVLINRPFGGGGLLRRLRERPLPPWAADIGATSWAQLLLKFVLAHPAVSCAIPGTSRPEHMADNALAGIGEIPDQAFWNGRSLELT